MLICGSSDLNFETVQEKEGVCVNPFPDTPFVNYQLTLLFLIPLLWVILVRGDAFGAIALGFRKCFESNGKYQVSRDLGTPCYFSAVFLVIPLYCNVIH